MSNITGTTAIMQEENELDQNAPAKELYVVESKHLASGQISYSIADNQAEAIKTKACWDKEYISSQHTVLCFVREDCVRELLATTREQTLQQVKRVIAARMEEL